MQKHPKQAIIPDSEKWLHEPEHLAKFDQALDWAEKNKPQDNFDQISKIIESIIKTTDSL